MQMIGAAIQNHETLKNFHLPYKYLEGVVLGSFFQKRNPSLRIITHLDIHIKRKKINI